MKLPRARSATAPAIALPSVPVTASLRWGAGVGIAEGVGSLYRSITGVGSGTGLRVGVVLGLGVGVTDGVVLGVGANGVGLGAGVTLGVGLGVVDGVVLGVGVGLGDADGVGVGVTDGLGADGLGLGVGVTEGVGVGVGVGFGAFVPLPSVPPALLISTVDSYTTPLTSALLMTVFSPSEAYIRLGV